MENDVTKNNVEQILKLAPLLPNRIEEAKDILAENFRWYYINEGLPELHGKTYVGLAGWKQFFQDLAGLTGGTFGVSLREAYALGTEFVVARANPNMTIGNEKISTDAAVVWRMVDGKAVEAWDIPGLNSALQITRVE